MKRPQPDPPNRDSDTRLSGSWLLLVRIVWLVLVVTVIGLYLAAIPIRIKELNTLCLAAPCPTVQLGPAGLDVIESFGMSQQFYAYFWISFDLLLLLVYFPVVAFIFWRKSDDWIAVLISLMLLLTVMSFTAPLALGEVSFFLQRSAVFLGGVSTVLQVTLLFLFPSGRFEPRWTRWIAILWSPVLLVTYLIDDGVSPVSLIPFVIGLTIGVAAQIYRYRRISTPTERQQTKWAIFGFAMFVGSLTFAILLNFIFPAAYSFGVPIVRREQIIYLMTIIPIMYLGIYALPVMFAFAILRYRLWDIDLIIRRTLIYGLITAVLAVVYFGGVIVLQSMFSGVTGGESPLAVVATTLLIAALFAPLRRRVQDFVDRRFYRRKYDLTRTVDGFAATLYEEVDIEHLSASLIRVVDKTMKPQHISLWVHDPHSERST